ncbi:MAG: bifunctional isocitrate dehydrogenase kinase/phosphatase [Anaerolineae bacterium]
MLDFNQLAELGAAAIWSGFNAYQMEFKAITRRAKSRFEQRDWHGVQSDAVARLDLYKKIVDGVVTETRTVLGDAAKTETVWAQMKAAYSRMIAGCGDFELAETFFNSITRRVFATVGVDREREFVDSDFNLPPARSAQPVYHTFRSFESTFALLSAIVAQYPFDVPFRSLDDDLNCAAQAVEAHLNSIGMSVPYEVEMLKSIFYRNKGAYIVGRIRSGAQVIPLVFALRHPIEGIVIDAMLLHETDVSIVFSFTRSYFSVEVENPYEVIEFLKSIMPLKRVAELYISIGYNKHGKTELYRDLLRHLRDSDDQFEIAPGDKGMVMMVFDLPQFDVVFKIIKDKFAYPKTATRQEVMEKYALVFKHDRAGRLVDAQEFEHLQFDRARFRDDLLRELLNSCANSVTVENDRIAIKHLYTERKMTPLNLFLRQVDDVAARAAVIDYGQAVKDLAATNIFPGDMLLKNFGVTRHGRVVFYDYDELGLLTDYNFREIPQSDNYDDETSADPWFYVGENDIFPEEFIKFFGLRPNVKDVFLDTHGDLLTADFWINMQRLVRAGEIVDVFPYPQSRRLHAV